MKLVNSIRYAPALLLASVAATFAVSGLPAMFPGSPWGAVALGVAIEVGTLAAFHALPRLRGTHRIAVLVVALIACALNALGVYGYLTRAHVEHAAAQSVAAEIGAAENTLAEIDRRLVPTTSTTEVVKHGKRTTVTVPGKVDPKLVDDRATTLATLTILRKKQEMNEAEIGPARYLADLLGKTADQTMELVIAAFVLVLQPFAIVLLWAARGATTVVAVAEPRKAKVVRKKRTTKRKAPAKKARVASNDNVLPLRPAA